MIKIKFKSMFSKSGKKVQVQLKDGLWVSRNGEHVKGTAGCVDMECDNVNCRECLFKDCFRMSIKELEERGLIKYETFKNPMDIIDKDTVKDYKFLNYIIKIYKQK